MDAWYEGTILLDVPPGSDGEFDRAALERMGHRVQVCHGPEGEARCPLLEGDGCPLFEQAHGIVFKLDLGVPQHREIVERYRRLGRPDMPIRVLAAGADAGRDAALLRDVEVWSHEPNVADLDGFAAEVEAADRLS
jgi:hypothetical protein